MGRTKEKLQRGEPCLGGWILIGHPTIAELLAGEGFDWICVDMEHTPTDYQTFQNIALALGGADCDLLVRLQGCDPFQAKRVFDAGANGIIVPSVNSRNEAELAVSIAKFPPAGSRGTAVSRAADFGRNFRNYFESHNERVIVVVMIEHVQGVRNLDEILDVDGIDAVFIGPYDLSASMNLAGKLDHPDVVAAQKTILKACRDHGVPAGIHVVPVDPDAVRQRVEEGYRFIACSLDTELILYGCRAILRQREDV